METDSRLSRHTDTVAPDICVRKMGGNEEREEEDGMKGKTEVQHKVSILLLERDMIIQSGGLEGKKYNHVRPNKVALFILVDQTLNKMYLRNSSMKSCRQTVKITVR